MTRTASVIRLRASSRTFRLTATLCVCAQLASALPLLASERPAYAPSAADQSSAPPAVKVNRSVPTVTPAPAYPVFSETPTDAEITRARVFGEPLVPIGVPTALLENQAFARAVTRYLQLGQPEMVAPFLTFLSQYRESPWRASLMLNLGGIYRQNGYLSRALQAWDEAWQLAKNQPQASAHNVADLAIGNWLQLTTKLGDMDALTRRLSEIEGRNMGGPAAVKVGLAREALWAMTYHHEMGVASGPAALDAILAMTRGDRHDVPQEIAHYHATPAGTSLAQLQQMANRIGMHLQAVARTSDVPVPAGSVVHLKAGHFSAVVRAESGRYLLRDLILGGYLWMSQNAINDEGSGFFLIPEGPLTDGWRTTTPSEADAIVGHCLGGAPDPDDPNTSTVGGDNGSNPPCGKGMPTYAIAAGQVSLRLTDIPAGCSPPAGPSGFFQVVYIQEAGNRPQLFWF